MALLTIEQAAKELEMKPSTLRKWRWLRQHGKDAPGLRFTEVGAAVRVDARDLAEFVDQCRAGGTKNRPTTGADVVLSIETAKP